MLVDDSILVQKDGEWIATVDLSTVQVPPAISALLASRLDRLSYRRTAGRGGRGRRGRGVRSIRRWLRWFHRRAAHVWTCTWTGFCSRTSSVPVPRMSAAAGGFASATSCCGMPPTMRSPRRSEPRSTKPSPSTCRLPLPNARPSSTSSSGTTSSKPIACGTSSACTTNTRTALRAPRSSTSARPGCGQPNEETLRRPRACFATRSTSATPTTPSGSRSRGCWGSPWRIRAPSPRRGSC